jgi:hypothetical protein
MSTLTLDYQDYESLVALARKGAELEGFIRAAEDDPTLRRFYEKAREKYGYDPNLVRDLEAFLKKIETANNITRYFLAIRWTEAGANLPSRSAGASTRFPENWPPPPEGTLELLTRAITRSDVDSFLEANAITPLTVMVTPDPGKRVGWALLEDYFR